MASDSFDIRYLPESETSEIDISKDAKPYISEDAKSSNGMLLSTPFLYHLLFAIPYIILFLLRELNPKTYTNPNPHFTTRTNVQGYYIARYHF